MTVNSITDIQASSQEAEALRPDQAALLLPSVALGIIGTGLLAWLVVLPTPSAKHSSDRSD